MLRLERNPTFWLNVALHPAVEPHVLQGAPPDTLADLVRHPTTFPVAAEHGGFLFVWMDGTTFELHTMFTPDGWGREVAEAAREALPWLFSQQDRPCDTLTTYEQQDYYRSRPPRSFGWLPTSDFAETHIGYVRTWAVTRDQWEASPVRKRERKRCRS